MKGLCHFNYVCFKIEINTMGAYEVIYSLLFIHNNRL